MSAVFTKPLLTLAEEALITTLGAPPLASNKVMEFTNSIVLTENTLLADLTEATYDGYAQGTVGTWAGPQLNLEGDLVIVPTVPIAFSCSGATTVNTVQGYGILNAAGTTLLAVATFDAPISPVPGQVHHVTPALAVTGTLDTCLC